MSPVTFELELPSDSRLHPVFHAALLESALSQVPIQTTLQTNGEKEYEVAEILDTRTTFSNKEYLVSWKGYSREENSWEPEANLQKCQQAISSYYQWHPEIPNLTSQVPPLHPRKTKAKQRRRAQGQGRCKPTVRARTVRSDTAFSWRRHYPTGLRPDGACDFHVTFV